MRNNSTVVFDIIKDNCFPPRMKTQNIFGPVGLKQYCDVKTPFCTSKYTGLY